MAASLSILAICGCNLVLSIDPGHLGAGVGGGEAGSGSGASTSTTASVAASTAAATGSGGRGGCADTTMSPENCGACGHDCLGGACVDSVCQPAVFAIDQGGVYGIAVSPVSLFWTSELDHTLYSKPIDGSADPTPFYTAPSGDPYAVTLLGNSICWTVRGAGEVLCDSTGGGARNTLSMDEGDPIAITIDGAYAYWLDGPFGPGGGIRRNLLSGAGLVETIRPDEVTGPVWAGIAVNGSSMFWASGRIDHGVHRSNTAGTNHVAIDTPTYAADIRYSSGNLYFTAADSVYVAPAGFTTNMPLVPLVPNQTSARGIEVHGPYVYWTRAEAGGAIMRAKLDGTDVVTLATGSSVAPVGPLAVDAAAVYWTDAALGGSVQRVAQ